MTKTMLLATVLCMFACGKKDTADKAADKAEDKPAAKASGDKADKADTDKADKADKADSADKADTKPEGDAPSCEVAVDAAYKVVEASDDATLKQLAIDSPRAKTTQTCKDQSWNADLRSCLVAAKTVDDVYHDCYVRPLKGRPLQIKRTFIHDNAAQNKAADPPMMTLDGDFYQVDKGCGVLFVDAKPGQALFVMCNGTTRGPLNMPNEVKEAFAVLAANEQTRHNIVMSLIAKMPSGRFGGTWKVCDQAGNCHVE